MPQSRMSFYWMVEQENRHDDTDIPRRKYNARVCHQRCKTCNKIGRPVLDGSYAERVTYWIKKWNGIAVEKPYTSGESKGPHKSELCEGCKAGHCSEAEDDWIVQMNRLTI